MEITWALCLSLRDLVCSVTSDKLVSIVINMGTVSEKRYSSAKVPN